MPLSEAAIGAIGSIGSSIFGSGLSGLFNFGSSAKAAKKSYKYQVALMNQQYDLQRKLNQNAYQDTTYSMRQAGINPMLAISNGSSGGSVGLGSVTQNAPQIDMDLQGAVGSAIAYKNEIKRIDNESKIADSTVKKQDYESDLAHEQSSFINEQNRLLQKYGDLERQQGLINSAKQADLLDNQMFNNNRLTNAQILNLSSDTSVKGNTALSLERDNKYAKDHPVIYGLSRASGAVPIIGAGAGIVGGSAVSLHNAYKNRHKPVGFKR